MLHKICKIIINIILIIVGVMDFSISASIMIGCEEETKSRCEFPSIWSKGSNHFRCVILDYVVQCSVLYWEGIWWFLKRAINIVPRCHVHIYHLMHMYNMVRLDEFLHIRMYKWMCMLLYNHKGVVTIKGWIVVGF